MSFETVLLSVQQGVALITLNLPKTRNAFNKALLRDLYAALDQIGADLQVRALILTGAGFCSGADLSGGFSSDARARADAGADHLRDTINPLALKIGALPFPVTSAVNGAAAGAGASLALAADVMLAARSAFFLFPFVPKLGILSDLGATWHLQQRLGAARAMALFLIGDRLAADKAAQRNDFSAQLDYECQRQRDLLGSAEFSEGVAAFVSKREPQFPSRGL
ncbi:MAG: enoyl-CoA hydratase-related protein [Panacagrimonas sp.]